MAANRGPWLSTATALFFCWATLSLLVRWWVKLKRRDNWGWDDTSISTAFLIALFHVGAIFWSVNYGYGRPLSSHELHKDEVEKSLYASQISYVVAIGLTKVSTSFFIGRLTRYPPQVLAARILAGISGAWTIASILIIAFRGNLSRPWTALDGSEGMFVRWIIVEIIGLVLEVTLFGLAVNLIWGLKMKMQSASSYSVLLAAVKVSTKARTPLFFFSLQYPSNLKQSLLPLVIMRLIYLSPSRNPTPTYSSIVPSILTEGTLQFAFMSASVTSLKPFLRPFHSGRFIVNTAGAPSSGLRTGGKSDRTYYELSGPASAATTMSDDRTRTTSWAPSFAFDGKALGLGTSTSFVEAVPPPPPRTKKTKQKKNILAAITLPTAPLPTHSRKASSEVRRQHRRGGGDNGDTESRTHSISHSLSHSLDSGASDRMIIRKTRAWSVRYEDREVGDVDEQRLQLRNLEMILPITTTAPAAVGGDVGVAI